MEFLVLEQEKREDIENEDKITFRRFDYNLYFSLENEEEEMRIVETMKKFFKYKFRVLKYKNFRELVVFLPETTKSKALEFSTALKKKMKKSKKEKIKMEKQQQKEEKKPIPIKPTRFISLTGYKNRERIGVFDCNLKLLYEVERSKNIIKDIQDIMEVKQW